MANGSSKLLSSGSSSLFLTYCASHKLTCSRIHSNICLLLLTEGQCIVNITVFNTDCNFQVLILIRVR